MLLEVVLIKSLLFALGSTQTDIRKPPKITRSPFSSLIYRENDNVTLECKGEGAPTLAYDWTKDGKQLNETLQKIHICDDGTITIQQATSMDEGFYQCFARNRYGTALSITTHLQRAFLESTLGNASDVLNKTVQVGMPFHIPADPCNSFPTAVYSWQTVNDTEDNNPTQVWPSSRIQIAENGDLYFAYALPDDDSRLYGGSTYNPYLGIKAEGRYTQLTVTGNSSNVSQFSSTLGFSSDAQTVALIGRNVTLRCFFFGYPEPTILWSKPGSSFSIGRYLITNFNTEFTIINITASDEGDYVCAASNIKGNRTLVLRIRVEAVPNFLTVKDGPYDLNVTKGDSVNFNCNANAKPEAKITWLQDGKELNWNNPPKRFQFSLDKRSLTIFNVCRDCVDRETKTDLMVIQCNASNVHGYAFAQGYLNVLNRTRVEIEDVRAIGFDDDDREGQFKCRATSDPSTPPTIRWVRVGKNGTEKPIQSDPPTVTSTGIVLAIHVNPNGTQNRTSYAGEYRCIGENGYSRDVAKVYITPAAPDFPAVPDRPWSIWWIYAAIGAACALTLLLVIITGIVCVRRGRRRRHGKRRGFGAKRCDYVRTSDIGPFRRGYPTEGTS